MAELRGSIARLGPRRTSAAVMLGIWLVVVLIGAGPAAGSETWIGIPSFDWLTWVLVFLVVMGAMVVLIAILSTSKSEGGPPAKRRPIWPLLIMGLLFLLFARRQPTPSSEPEIDQEVAEALEPPPIDVTNAGGGVGGQELAVLLVMLAVAIGVVLLSRRRLSDDHHAAEDHGVEHALAPALQTAAEQLLEETDPRSSVLLAYRGLETTLEAHGLPREGTETPSEYLRRVLSDLPLDTDPLLTLSDLYQEARFSEHEITSADRDAAHDALKQVRRHLPAAAGEPS